ncbi:MAG: type IV secretory system conjugative DNA transfer family protein [Flavobacteriales bacterium]|nr:type IV secretory system conjugative DNA transfer family protein [Flavobacteriales bacterium]
MPADFENHLIYLLLSFAGGALSALFIRYVLKPLKDVAWILFCLLLGLFTPLGYLAGFAAGYWMVINDLRKKPKPQTPKPKLANTSFGSAEWATEQYLQENGLTSSEGLKLGLSAAGSPVSYKGDRHLLTVAPTRTGKGVSAIIPNLLTYEGSALVIDPKGENAMITAERRGRGTEAITGLGQDIHIVDPWGITNLQCSCFNPLDWLDPSDEDISENAFILADAMIVSRGNKIDPFWDEEAKALLRGLILHVAVSVDEQGNRNLGRVRDILLMKKQDFAVILNTMANSENHIVSKTAEKLTAHEDKLLSNILAACQSHTHFLDSPRIRRSLSHSDFKFEDLKTKKQTIYLVLPVDRLNAFSAWLRLLIQQAITVNSRNITEKPDKPILFLLDEMASLGRLQMIEQAYSLMSGFGIQLWGIIQDLSQLDRIYDKGWETFLGNSGVLQYFGSRDLKTAEYFSKLCGVTTIEKTSTSNSTATGVGSGQSTSNSWGNKNGSHSQNQSTTDTEGTTTDVAQRQLAYADELMVLKNRTELLFIENHNPVKGQKITWYKDQPYSELGINLEAKAKIPESEEGQSDPD